MRLAETVASVFEGFSIAEPLAWIESLSTLNRYQASKDIEVAAQLVAETAEESGLSSVELRTYPADGERRWWTFRAPRSWTPVEAKLEIGDVVVTSYPREHCGLATYSAPTPPGGVTAALADFFSDPSPALEGTIAVIPRSDLSLQSILERLEQSRALGFVTDAVSMEGQVGRIELSPGSPLFGFSVTPSSLRCAIDAARRNETARAMISVDDNIARMPVVTGLLQGEIDDEILLQAHLCHPSPGANDNLSGVAALLGLVRTLDHLRSSVSPRRTIRFLWGPEFVGTAAFLHDVIESGADTPMCAINLDMVGENQRECGGPLIIERSADHVPSFLDALVETAVEVLPPEGTSYSGSVATSTWAWRATPFAGASDHLLYADRMVSRPAVQIGHWPDRFNHSSADTLDKVDPDELRRSAAAAGASALLAADPAEAGHIGRIVARWGSKLLGEVAALVWDAPEGVRELVDPRSSEHARGLLTHTEGVVQDSLRSAGASWASPMMRAQADALASALPDGSVEPAHGKRPTGGVIERLWPGPFNLRGLTEETSAADAGWIRRQAAEGRHMFPLMTSIALAIDGSSSLTEVIRRAAYSSRLPIDVEFGERFMESMIGAGWAREVSKSA